MPLGGPTTGVVPGNDYCFPLIFSFMSLFSGPLAAVCYRPVEKTKEEREVYRDPASLKITEVVTQKLT
jgi:hypothetical protein